MAGKAQLLREEITQTVLNPDDVEAETRERGEVKAEDPRAAEDGKNEDEKCGHAWRRLPS